MGYYIPEVAAEVVGQILTQARNAQELDADKPQAGMTMAALGFDHDDHDYYEPFAAS